MIRIEIALLYSMWDDLTNIFLNICIRKVVSKNIWKQLFSSITHCIDFIWRSSSQSQVQCSISCYFSFSICKRGYQAHNRQRLNSHSISYPFKSSINYHKCWNNLINRVISIMYVVFCRFRWFLQPFWASPPQLIDETNWCIPPISHFDLFANRLFTNLRKIN